MQETPPLQGLDEHVQKQRLDLVAQGIDHLANRIGTAEGFVSENAFLMLKQQISEPSAQSVIDSGTSQQANMDPAKVSFSPSMALVDAKALKIKHDAALAVCDDKIRQADADIDMLRLKLGTVEDALQCERREAHEGRAKAKSSLELQRRQIEDLMLKIESFRAHSDEQKHRIEELGRELASERSRTSELCSELEDNSLKSRLSEERISSHSQVLASEVQQLSTALNDERLNTSRITTQLQEAQSRIVTLEGQLQRQSTAHDGEVTVLRKALEERSSLLQESVVHHEHNQSMLQERSQTHAKQVRDMAEEIENLRSQLSEKTQLFEFNERAVDSLHCSLEASSREALNSNTKLHEAQQAASQASVRAQKAEGRVLEIEQQLSTLCSQHQQAILVLENRCHALECKSRDESTRQDLALQHAEELARTTNLQHQTEKTKLVAGNERLRAAELRKCQELQSREGELRVLSDEFRAEQATRHELQNKLVVEQGCHQEAQTKFVDCQRRLNDAQDSVNSLQRQLDSAHVEQQVQEGKLQQLENRLEMESSHKQRAQQAAIKKEEALADLEARFASLEEGNSTSERQLAISQQKAESLRLDLKNAKARCQEHMASLAEAQKSQQEIRGLLGTKQGENEGLIRKLWHAENDRVTDEALKKQLSDSMEETRRQGTLLQARVSELENEQAILVTRLELAQDETAKRMQELASKHDLELRDVRQKLATAEDEKQTLVTENHRQLVHHDQAWQKLQNSFDESERQRTELLASRAKAENLATEMTQQRDLEHQQVLALRGRVEKLQTEKDEESKDLERQLSQLAEKNQEISSKMHRDFSSHQSATTELQNQVRASADENRVLRARVQQLTTDLKGLEDTKFQLEAVVRENELVRQQLDAGKQRERTMSSEKDQTQLQLTESRSELQRTREQVTTACVEASRLQEELKDVLAQLNQSETESSTMSRELERHSHMVDSLQAQLSESAQKYEALSSQHRSLSEECKVQQSRIAEFQKNTPAKDRQISQLTQEMELREEQFQSTRDALESAMEELSNVSENAKRRDEATSNELNESVQRSRELAADLHQSDEKLTQEVQRNRELSVELQESDGRQKQLTAKLQASDKELESYYRELLALKAQMKEIAQENRALRTAHVEREDSNDTLLRQKLDQLEHENSQLHRALDNTRERREPQPERQMQVGTPNRGHLT